MRPPRALQRLRTWGLLLLAMLAPACDSGYSIPVTRNEVLVILALLPNPEIVAEDPIVETEPEAKLEPQGQPAAQNGGVCNQAGVADGTLNVVSHATSVGDGCAPDAARAGAAMISAYNGQEVLTERDLAIRGRDPDVSFQILRRHLSGIAQDDSVYEFDGGVAPPTFLENSPFGINWAFNYRHAFRVMVDGSLQLRSFGRRDLFTATGTNVWEGSSGRYGRLAYDGSSTATLMMVGGTTITFQAEIDPDGALVGLVSAIESRQGNRLTFEYEPASSEPDLLERRLLRIYDSFGRPIEFFYEDPDYATAVSRIRDFSGRETLYDYNSLGQLLSVRSPTVTSTGGLNDFPQGKLTQYGYADLDVDEEAVVRDFLIRILGKTEAEADQILADPNDPLGPPSVETTRRYFALRIGSKTAPNQAGTSDTRLTWTYYALSGLDQGMVSSHTVGNPNAADPAGGTYTYSYAPIGLATTDPNSARFRTTVVDRRGTTSVFEFNRGGQMLFERIQTRGFRSNQPPEYVKSFQYNADGDLVSSLDPNGIQTTYVISDDASQLRRSRRNQTAKIVSAAPGKISNQAQRTWQTDYEPILNQVFKEIDPRGFEPGNDPADFTTIYIYDWMEDLDAAIPYFAPRLGITEADLLGRLQALGLGSAGDVNGDGITNQFKGNVIQVIHPTVSLPAEATRAGVDPNQPASELYTYNDFGQMTRHVDAEGNVTVWEYYGADDPDGDGVIDSAGANSQTGGYLKSITRDAVATPGRNSGHDAPPALQKTAFAYTAQGTFAANPRGVPTAVTDPRGILHAYLINELDQTVIERRAADTTASPESLAAFAYERRSLYDANDNLIEAREQNRDTLDGDDDFIVHQFEYDILDQRTRELWDVGGENIENRFDYDESQNLVTERFGIGADDPSAANTELARIEHTYDERDLRISTTRGAGEAEASTTFEETDDNGNVVAWIDASGDRREWIRDGFDRLLIDRDRVGNETQLQYDSASNVIRIQWISSVGAILAETHQSFDTRNRMFRQGRALFHYPGQSFGPRDQGDLGDRNPSAVCLPPCVGKIFVHDRDNRLIAIVDGDDDTYLQRFDGLSRLSEMEDPAGNVVEFSYDPNDNLVQTVEREVSSALPNEEVFVTARTYDALDRMVARVEPNAQTTTFAYDSRDNLVLRVDDLQNQTQYRYDRLNRLTDERRYLGTGEIDRTGAGGAPGNTTTAAGGDGIITTTQVWDDRHRLIQRLDDNGNATTYVYDDLDRMIRQDYADGTSESWTYNTDSELLTHVNPKGSTATWAHDAKSRPVSMSVSHPPGIVAAGTTLKTWTFDGLDRLIYTTDDGGAGSTALYDYDSLSRVVREVQQVGSLPARSVITDWVAENQRRVTQYPNGRRVVHTYDELDREIGILEESTGATIAAYTYVGPWRDLLRVQGNGTVLDRRNDQGVASISGAGAGYDANRRVVRQRWVGPGGSVADYAMAYNRLNHIVEERRDHLGRGDAFSLDSTNRLETFDHDLNVVSGALAAPTAAERSTWALDGAHNWEAYIRRTIDQQIVVDTAGGVNEYASVAGQTQSYDDNGNLIADGAWEYVYDFDNRLAEVRLPGGPAVFRYTYDASNRRLLKETPGGATRYLYRGWDVLEEKSVTSLGETPARQFVYRAGIDEPVQLRTDPLGPSQADYYYHEDARGNIGALTNASGAVEYYVEYDAYGAAANGTYFIDPSTQTPFAAEPLGNPYLWHARRFEPETGDYYYRNRYYRPETGRFVESDPLGQWEDYVNAGNRYAFGGARPGALDPLGLDTQVIITRDAIIGDHAAVRVDNSGDGIPVLYDPAGSYPSPGPDLYHPSSDIFTGDDANLNDYLDYQISSGGEADIYTIPTTPEQEKAIANAAIEHGGRSIMDCANAVGTVLSGTIPGVSKDQGLPSLGVSWPRGLGAELSKVPGVSGMIRTPEGMIPPTNERIVPATTKRQGQP